MMNEGRRCLPQSVITLPLHRGGGTKDDYPSRPDCYFTPSPLAKSYFQPLVKIFHKEILETKEKGEEKERHLIFMLSKLSKMLF